jgi:phage terminase large subunit GpA-like protein
MALILEYRVNLLKIDGTGDFPCPKCGVPISPDDETDDTYSIVEQKTRRDILEELIIQCNHCKSLIRLTGFLLLEK